MVGQELGPKVLIFLTNFQFFSTSALRNNKQFMDLSIGEIFAFITVNEAKNIRKLEMAKFVLLLSALSFTGCMTAADKLIWSDVMKEDVVETSENKSSETDKEVKANTESKPSDAEKEAKANPETKIEDSAGVK